MPHADGPAQLEEALQDPRHAPEQLDGRGPPFPQRDGDLPDVASAARWGGTRYIWSEGVLYFRLADGHDVGVELEEFRTARARLARVGYQLRPEPEAWESFRRLRSEYAMRINSLATYWASPPAQWIGDRSPLKYRARHDGHVLSSDPPGPAPGH